MATATLSGDDLDLLWSRSTDVIHDPERFRRYNAIHGAHEHPDTGEPIDFQAERLRASTRNTSQGTAAQVNQSSGAGGRAVGPNSLDMLQLGADAVGVVDPTGIVDAANAGVSLVRAIRDPERRGEHLRNAAISAISIIPFVGDLAKLKKVESAKDMLRMAASSRSGARARAGGGREAAGAFADAVAAATGAGGAASGGSSGETGGQGGSGSGSGGSMGGMAGGGGSRGPGGSSTTFGSAGGGFGGFGAGFAGKVDDIIMGAGALVGALFGLKRTIEGVANRNRALIDSETDLANFNPEIAGAFARGELARVRRQIERGRILDDPMAEAIAADTRFRDATDRISAPLKGISLDLSATATNFTAHMIEMGDVVFRVSERLRLLQMGTDVLTDAMSTGADKVFGAVFPGTAATMDALGDGEKQAPWQHFLDDIRDGDYDDMIESSEDFFTRGL